MVVEYNKDMKLIYYSETKDIEIATGDFPDQKWCFYFKNKYELADLLKSNPKLLKELKELI